MKWFYKSYLYWFGQVIRWYYGRTARVARVIRVARAARSLHAAYDGRVLFAIDDDRLRCSTIISGCLRLSAIVRRSVIVVCNLLRIKSSGKLDLFEVILS